LKTRADESASLDDAHFPFFDPWVETHGGHHSSLRNSIAASVSTHRKFTYRPVRKPVASSSDPMAARRGRFSFISTETG
jgi:hypothetical protein